MTEQVLYLLSNQHPPALFFSELAAKLPGGSALEPTVKELEAQHAVLVSSFPAPDPHLDGLDLRIVALVPPAGDVSALEASASLWADWLRQFLATHRCQ